MADTLEIDGNQVPITGHTDDGVPIVQGFPTTIHHTDDAGNPIFDEEGNPKVSVHISVSPPVEPVKE